MRLALITLCLLPTLLLGEPRFPEAIELDGSALKKLGEERYLHKRIFKVYDAALYSANSGTAEDILAADCEFKLKFSYLRTIDRQLAIDAADQMLSKNLSPEERAQIASRLEEINETYQSVEKGDWSTLHYRPGIGTTYSFKGQQLITIPGQDFAQLYFRVWLGEQPLSVRLRDALLGKS